MLGDATLWMPGTDHAGIATQTVVEKRLLSEGIKRLEMGREAFVAKTQEWKDEYEAGHPRPAPGDGRLVRLGPRPGSRWTTCAPPRCGTPSSCCSATA
jgi:hypothetical protein